MTAIAADGLTKFYGDTRGIEDLSFEVEEGEVFGYLGPNGAGKTTTIRTLLGFIAPTAGEATVLGRDVTDEADLIEAKRRIGYLPSDPGLDEGVTGRRIVEYHAELKGDERSAELLETFDAPVDREVGEYSRGNVQKLAIVLAFMHDPDLVIMDEPTSGLDPLMQDRFYEFIEAEKERGTTFFFSSHILSEVRRVCDRVGIIRRGELVALEEIETLLHRSGKRVEVSVEGALDPADFDLAGVHDLEASDGEAAFMFTGEFDTLLDHLRGYSVRDLEIDEAPLEDVFMRFYDDGDVGDAAEAATDLPTDDSPTASPAVSTTGGSEDESEARQTASNGGDDDA
ncbi:MULTISPECIES: ABC transporter ATP-binding protein [Halorussus]|uniref:ABC transporter ATP-binding protein n=1 Tax=Halorussus TaxID=1070314 RepID=UPI00209CAF51|nr:ABC transporter ATP-binding protein [Halorussus vallis]USZ75071.1 ABC transporter ATP-binding protein [Halorussus vallis]